MADTCKHCGTELPKNWKQPCPICGKTGKKISADVADRMPVSDDLAVGATHGETGRYAVHFDSRNTTDALQIEQLIKDFLLGNYDAFIKYIDNLVSQFSSTCTITGIFYRGIGLSSKNKLEGPVIGPPRMPREGRYNTMEVKALYLIDNVEFLSEEIGEKDMLVQEYRINLSNIRVANLSPKNTDISNSLSLLFQAAERGKTGSGFNFETELVKSGRSKYMISQLISAMFVNQHWQGLYVPGVHGKKGNHYINLAILGDCVDCWIGWTIGNYRVYSDGIGWIS